MLEVVLDTNVLVTALVSRRGASFQLIRLIGEGAFPPNVSVALALSDPDDELVLDLAIQRGAAILTHNKRDFAEAGKRGVAVLTPAEFLESLRQAK